MHMEVTRHDDVVVIKPFESQALIECDSSVVLRSSAKVCRLPS